MKLISAVVGIVVLLYFFVKYHHQDLFDHSETLGIDKKSNHKMREY